MTILLADDDPVQTTLLTELLKKKGHRVTVAHDAIQAALAAIRQTPDAIILDIQMPGGTGRAVLQQLKTDPKTKQIPVIVLTGSVNSSDQANFMKLGASEYLKKPVDVKLLFSILNKLQGAPA